MEGNKFSQWLDETARRLGAHSAACIRMDNPLLRARIEENTVRVAEWLQAGLHGEMSYLERMLTEKADPWSTFPFARSVVVVAFTNRWGDPEASHPFPESAEDALLGYVSAYARERDYHTVGQELLARLEQHLGEAVRAEAAVDTRAVYERLFAGVGGLGVVGGNDLLRVPNRTNVRVFIGCLFVEALLPEVIREPKMPFACADCLACVRNCPTGAIEFGQPIDARRCISYLTIEKRSLLSREEGEMIGDWIFGCDDCSVVCPPRDKVDTRVPVDLEWLFRTPAAEVRRIIRDNAVSYAGVTRLRRNAAVVLKNMNTDRAKEFLADVREKTGSDLIRRQIDLW
jgi:epoxyqueuosine reductase